MTRLSCVLTLLLLIVVLDGCGLRAVEHSGAAESCMAAQQKQFDFWVGEWDATWPGQNGSKSGHGTNSIMRILDGCVVQENFSGQGLRRCTERASPSTT